VTVHLLMQSGRGWKEEKRGERRKKKEACPRHPVRISSSISLPACVLRRERNEAPPDFPLLRSTAGTKGREEGKKKEKNLPRRSIFRRISQVANRRGGEKRKEKSPITLTPYSWNKEKGMSQIHLHSPPLPRFPSSMALFGRAKGRGEKEKGGERSSSPSPTPFYLRS